MRSVGIEVGERGELHMLPAIAWPASFGLCALGDLMLGRWTLLPLFVVSFYGGTFIIRRRAREEGLQQKAEAAQAEGFTKLIKRAQALDRQAGRPIKEDMTLGEALARLEEAEDQ